MKPRLVSGRATVPQYQVNEDLAILSYLQPEPTTLQPLVETRIIEQPTLFNLNMFDNALQNGIKTFENFYLEGDHGKSVYDTCK